MKGKRQDDLIRLAFGDLDAEAANVARAQAEADPATARELAQLEAIRAGLKQMPTPAPQISSERLREAILRRGLEEQPKRASWTWSLAPLAVAAAAVWITVNVMGGSGPIANRFGVGDVKGEETVADRRTFSDKPIEFQPTVRDPIPAVVPAPAATEPASRPTEVAEATKREKTVPPPASTDEARLKVASVFSNPVPAPSVVSEAAPALSPELLSAWALEGAMSSGETEARIVLIGAESDEATGANRAIEVSSASNVVVGG